MRYASFCSGVEAATVAWHGLGWKPALFAEIDKFPSRVLAHHYPEVKNVGDFTKITKDECGSIDLAVAGTLCQDFSVAGLRAGLDGKRGQLTIEFAQLVGRLRPRWLVWENVPGVLSTDGGRAFGIFIGLLGKLRYGISYRILDAQFVGVPQRRRRVFVVGYLGDWRRSAAVLLERQSLSGDTPPRRETREDVAPTISARTKGGGGLGTDFDCDGGLIASTGETSHCLNGGGMGRQDYETETLISHSLRGGGFDASEDGTGRGTPLLPVVFDCKASGRNGFGIGENAPTLRAMAHRQTHQNAGGQLAVMTLAIRGRGGSPSLEVREDCIANAVLTPNGGRAGIGVGAIQYGMAVRRLTPRECERLQGFPDDYTLIRIGKKWAADGPRYKALGNSMAVPVMRWIGERIAMVDAL